MRNKKLRLVDILTLVKQERCNEIPEGYKIEWFGPEPGNAFEFEATKDDITMTRNNPPKPSKLTIVGESVPFFPISAMKSTKIVDYGTVVIRTILNLKSIDAVYNLAEIDTKEFMEWVRKCSEPGTGRLYKKEEITFDMKVSLSKELGAYMDIFNLSFTDINFPGFDDEECMEATAKFICDHFVIHP